uniref:Mab-21-like HhH/H2TH-like domain-containing protein n=1 Tax=Clytia hemisphaerica TaxID=252671 RepID=A0A7M5XGX6_9CNID
MAYEREMFMTADEATPLLTNQPEQRQDNYEAEVAYKTLKRSETILFMVEGYEPSHVLFPTLVQRYLTGSRAEFLYVNRSDYDYLYEIGPGLVRDFREKRHGDPTGDFYWKPTENPGFYTIEDTNGRFLYSHIVQQKLAPLFLTGQEPHKRHRYNFEDTSKTNAAITYSDKDYVIGLRLAEWPKELLECFPIHELKSKLKNVPLFLIAKSFPGSSLTKLEWRISFSLVELEILLHLPYYQRKAFLHLKHSLMSAKEIPTYLLKTIFLSLSATYEKEHPQTEWNTQEFHETLCENVERMIEQECISNFFIPGQNLCLLIKRAELDEINKIFRNLSLSNMPNLDRGDLSFTMTSISNDDAILSCLAFTYFEIMETIYDMVVSKAGAKKFTGVKTFTLELLSHKYTDDVKGPFRNLVRINSHFDGTQIEEADFLLYISDLALIELDSNEKLNGCCIIYFGFGYFSATGHAAQTIQSINHKYKIVVDWMDRIVARIKQHNLQDKESSIWKSRGKTFLKNPTDFLRDSHFSDKKRIFCVHWVFLMFFAFFFIFIVAMIVYNSNQ